MLKIMKKYLLLFSRAGTGVLFIIAADVLLQVVDPDCGSLWFHTTLIFWNLTCLLRFSIDNEK